MDSKTHSQGSVEQLPAPAAPAQGALPDPFSPSPSRSASSASSTRSSRSDDSISPSASASQVKDHASRLAAAVAPELAEAQTQSQLAQASTAAQGQNELEPVEPPPPVDAFQPSPLHMLTLLGSQLLQHDQHRQQDEQAHDLGLSGIPELFNEEEAARLEIDEEEASLYLQHHLPSYDAMEQSRSSLPQTPHLSASLTENLRLGAAAASVPLRALPLALVQESVANMAAAGELDEQTPRGPLTPLQASQLLISPVAPRSRESTHHPSSLSPKIPSTVQSAESEQVPISEVQEGQDVPISVPESSKPRRSLAFASPELPTKAPTVTARQLLATHLVKLFGLPPSITAADGATRPVRVLSLHPAHLFRSGTLLTGTLYLTSTHMLFYAYMRPRAPGAVLQMGMLGVARGKGWGFADDAWAKSHHRSSALSASPSVAQESGSDSVATLQGHGRGSFGAAARIGAFFKMPSAALGVGAGASSAAQGSGTTPSPTDSAFLFGTTPTTRAPFGGFEPVSSTAATASAGALPSRQIQSTATGLSFSRRAPRKRAHHFVLTPRSLSWFASERDPYFPVGQLDLRWIRAVYEPVATSDTTSGITDKAANKAVAEWHIEYVIPPGPRTQQKARSQKGTKAREDTDEQERRYTLLLRAPSAEEALSWCTAVRRAVLRAGGGESHQHGKSASTNAQTNAGASLDVGRDSVRVSIPLARIVDVEGSVGASGVSGANALSGGVFGERTGGRKGKERATESSERGEGGIGTQPGLSAGSSRPEDDEGDGRTFVIRVWDVDTKSTSSTQPTTSHTEDAEDVVPLDEYCFVDVQRQQDLWRRLERALARIPAAAAEVQSAGREGANVEEELARTYTEKPVPFTYPPSITRPISPRMTLPRALSGPAKRLATGLAFTRPVAVGLGLGASNVKNFVGYQAMGLVERVKEVWTVAPPGVSGGEGIGSPSPSSQPASRSRSQSGSEGWIADEMKVEDGEEGEEEGVDTLEEEGDAEADLADSMSFSIVDLSSSTGNLDGPADESDIDNISSGGNGSKARTKAEQYNLDLFYRTFVLPLSPSSLSFSDPDILGARAETFSSPGSRSGTSSSLDRSATAERLLHTFSTASLYRVLPIAGRLFVSERFLCFRSARGLASRVNAGLGGLAQGAAGLAAAVSNLAAQPGVGTAAAAAGAAARPLLAATGFAGTAGSLPTAGSGAGGAATGGGRTLMMLPLADVIGVANNRAYRYGHSGMVVMVRGHEEIFFEFSSVNEQRLCISTIEHQMEVLHRNSADRTNRAAPITLPTAERSDAFILRDLGERLDWSMHSSIHSNFPGSSIFAVGRLDDDLDAPAQAARRLRSELGMTSPVTSPSSPKFSRAALSPNRSGAGDQPSQRKRSRSISTMSAPGLRSVGGADEEELGRAGPVVPAGGVSTTGTDTGTTASSDLLSISSKPRSSLHFTMLTIGSRGDVQPYIALSKRLLAEGHRVRIATHGEFREWVEGHGIEFYEVGGDPAELMRICVENGTFTLSFLREGVTKFRGWLDDLLVSSWAACQGTDIVIESPSAMAGIHIAEALQVPYFRAFTMPWTRTRTYPHAFAVPSGKAGGNYNYMTYVIFDQVFWRASAGQVNRWRRKTLGLRSTNLEELSQHKVPFLYNFSPSLVPKPLDWYDWIHVTGFWFLDGPENSKTRMWEPPGELVAFILKAREAKRKVVYIGWGSIVLSNAEETHQIVVEAVRQSGVCAILSKGWSDRLSNKKQQQERSEDQQDMSDRILELDSVPHDWLFPQLDAACHHGGAGTLGASLRAGIPTIVKPHFADQFFWGQQVETLGVGRCIRGSLSQDKLAEAIQAATRDERMVRRARELGERIVRENGVGEAIKAIYRDLDYASSLIKRGTGLDGRSGGKAFVPSAATPAPTRIPARSTVPPATSLPSASSRPADTFVGTSIDPASAGLTGRKSRETVREAPFAMGGGRSASTEARSRGGDDSTEDDAESETMSEAWSVVSGSEDDR